MNPSDNLSFTKKKKLWLDGRLRIEPRRDGIAWLKTSETWEGSILAEGLRDWESRAVPFFDCTLAFALQLRKSTENLSHGRRSVLDTNCVDLAATLEATSTCLLSMRPLLPVA
jgi:hypothetical protein